jgi:hypothetical protein
MFITAEANENRVHHYGMERSDIVLLLLCGSTGPEATEAEASDGIDIDDMVNEWLK